PLCSPCISFTSHPPHPTCPHTLSLHDALPIFLPMQKRFPDPFQPLLPDDDPRRQDQIGFSDSADQFDPQSGFPSPGRRHDVYFSDRKSTRLNSSHVSISYAVFCLKKKRCAVLR